MTNKEAKAFMRYLLDYYDRLRQLESAHVLKLMCGVIGDYQIHCSVYFTYEFSCFCVKAIEISDFVVPGEYYVMDIDFVRSMNGTPSVGGHLNLYTNRANEFSFICNKEGMGNRSYRNLDRVKHHLDHTLDKILKASLTYEYAEGLRNASGAKDYKRRFLAITGRETEFENTLNI